MNEKKKEKEEGSVRRRQWASRRSSMFGEAAAHPLRQPTYRYRVGVWDGMRWEVASELFRKVREFGPRLKGSTLGWEGENHRGMKSSRNHRLTSVVFEGPSWKSESGDAGTIYIWWVCVRERESNVTWQLWVFGGVVQLPWSRYVLGGLWPPKR